MKSLPRCINFCALCIEIVHTDTLFRSRIAAGFSTAEVASLGLFFLWACIKAERDRDRPSTATNSEGCGFMLWINFLLWAPMGTGIYIWSLTTKYSHCESGSRSARCRIGKGIVTAIGVYRTLGVYVSCSCRVSVERLIDHQTVHHVRHSDR